MKTYEQQYILVELRSGFNWMHRYDRTDALEAAHKLNKLYPKERWAICAV